jgi:hypothetical protein
MHVTRQSVHVSHEFLRPLTTILSPGVARTRGSHLSPVDVLVAGGVAAVVSGIPSTVHALAKRIPLSASTAAAGTLLGKASIIRGLVAHAALSIAWAAALARVLPRRHRIAAGALGGAAIAALDLGVFARHYPAIRALPHGPQWADHVLFGATVGAVLDARTRR